MRGRAYAGLGELRRAVSDYTKAINGWPGWAGPYESRADAYEQLGMEKKALADRYEAARRARS